MHLCYRISDKSYAKPKLPGATKAACLKNFLSAFADLIFTEDVLNKGAEPPCFILADNCTRETMRLVNDTGLPIIETQLSNAGSLRHAINFVCNTRSDEDIIYFSEDDYLHQGRAMALIEDGLKHADYLTLYDHPDKYTRMYNGGETSKVICTKHSHWRYTISTCMTFGVKVKTLREDLEVWEKFTNGHEHPDDHKIFTELNQRGRKLIVPIPGAACHTDMTFSGQIGMLTMEDWAIEYLTQEFEKTMGAEAKAVLGNKQGWARLQIADAIKQMTNYN